MAVNFACSFTTLCCLALWGLTRTSDATNVLPPHSTTKPGFPISINTNNPGVRQAARLGVYRYNNSSNDIFLFKELQINKAMVQIVRGLKYMLHVEIGRTVCEKREHSSLDSCHFQKKRNLQQIKVSCHSFSREPSTLSLKLPSSVNAPRDHPTSAYKGWTIKIQNSNTANTV